MMNRRIVTRKTIMQMRKNMRGITLMELMIVVVIVGILTAIAFPNYRNFVARAARSEAKAALLKCATNQEKFYLQNQQFTTNLAQLGFSAPFKTDSANYQITVALSGRRRRSRQVQDVYDRWAWQQDIDAGYRLLDP
jgi:prepilin-type N-terminal cleavage/methylation domain-containing protein